MPEGEKHTKGTAMTMQKQEICTEVLIQKYAKNNETTEEEVKARVAKCLASVEKEPEAWEQEFLWALNNGFIPGGRINSAAGTDLTATLINCFVQPVGDSVLTTTDGYLGIYPALTQAAETMRKGGGVGYDFSRIRPKGAFVKTTNSFASGPISYMRVFDRSCETIESAGSRRGAQLSSMRCDHPDIFEYIHAKDKGDLTNFNMSVNVTDSFMEAVILEKDIELVHKVEPLKSRYPDSYQRKDGLWVYKKVPAKDIWNEMMKSTYDHAEPGVLFIDTINKDNNLKYCETIETTNPCVTGDTVILTNAGHIPIELLVGKETTIWNGKEWSNVTPYVSGENEYIYDIEFSDGSSLSCTPNHQFVLHNESKITAKELQVQDKLVEFTYPLTEGYKEYDTEQAYISGYNFLVKPSSVPFTKLSGLKKSILESVKTKGQVSYTPKPPIVTAVRSSNESILNATYTIKSRLAWIAGLIDSYGVISKEQLVLRCENKNKLLQIKYLLSTLSCNSTLRSTEKDTYVLTICSFTLVCLGIQNFNIDLLSVNSKAIKNTLHVVSKTLREKTEAKVYCFTEPLRNTGIFNGVLTGNCAEQPLPPYGCCCLGSVNLTVFVEKYFTSEAYINYTKLKEVVKLAVRMLDNVLDATQWPLQEQKREAQLKRRVGLGFTGLGNALAMLCLKYDTQEARNKATEIAEAMRNFAYEASVELAKEKGAFPLLDANKYLTDTFASRLPTEIKDKIRKTGIRNSHLLSVAPTGSISIAFANNASNGIEPPFSYFYTRKKRNQDNTTTEHKVCDYGYLLYKHTYGEEAELPSYFTTALDISATDHAAMVAAVAPYIDSAISKTINVPEDYSYDDFKDIYLYAWKNKIKGIATYRPNSVLGSVLSVEPKEVKEVKKEHPVVDLNTRFKHDKIHSSLSELKWPNRPLFEKGNPAWCYMIETNENKFTVFIGHVENGKPFPFEVWVNGPHEPESLAAVAKTLSMDMRVKDRAWLQYKLGLLAETSGSPVDVQLFDGKFKRYKSIPSALSHMVTDRCNELQVFNDIKEDESSMINNLLFLHEPNLGTTGTLSWTVNINNHMTNDNFTLGLKEIDVRINVNNESKLITVPYSIWLAGEYSTSLNGLTSLLSGDMRIADFNWIGLKLKKLLTYKEPSSEFFTTIPGENKQMVYPSTVAYMADLILYRYQVLGILNKNGNSLLSTNTDFISTPASEVGKECPECFHNTLIKKDGCNFCTTCGYIGNCG